MKIGIDARFLTHPQAGGFKTYTQNLIAALAEVDQENEYVLYVDRELDSHHPVPRASNMECKIVRGKWPLLGMLVREQFGLAQAGWRDRLDLLHCPALTAPLLVSCPLVVTLHDTLWHTVSLFQSRLTLRRQLMASYYRRVPERAARKASVIITVSKAAKADIVNRLGIPPERVVVTYEAAASDFKPVSNPDRLNAVRAKYALPSSFVMAIGSADPRKNIDLLLNAYARLPEYVRNLHHLAILWTHPDMVKQIQYRVELLRLTRHCHFLHDVSTEDMVRLYNAAELFVFPSRYEGFGLPPLEAMSCGTAVIASNNSSIPEILADAAYLVDAERPEQIAQAMIDLLGSAPARTELVRRGLQHAALFSWNHCARQTVEVYRQCARRANRPMQNFPMTA